MIIFSVARIIHSLAGVLLLTLASCAVTKTPYVSDSREPVDLPPSPSYMVVLLALRDELPHHQQTGAFYLCQSRQQVAALQRDLPGFTLKHASETYTAPVKDWPVAWSHRISDDAIATRVSFDIKTETPDIITATLSIGYQAPNLTEVHYTFFRRGASWRLLQREEMPEMKI